MNYYYTGKALDELENVMGVYSKKRVLEVLADAGIKTTMVTLRNWSRNGVIPVLTLIGICNIAKLPIAHFINYDGVKRHVERYVTMREDWVPIRWDTVGFIDDCLSKFLHRKTVVEVVGMSEKMYDAMRKGDMNVLRHMEINKFIDYVNRSGLYIDNYLVDRNVKYIEFTNGQYFCDLPYTVYFAEDGNLIEKQGDVVEKLLQVIRKLEKENEVLKHELAVMNSLVNNSI